MNLKFITLTIIVLLSNSVVAGEHKKFMECGFEAEVVLDVIDSKIKGKSLNDIIVGWQETVDNHLTKKYVEEMVTFAFLNYPVLSKLTIANRQLKICLQEQGLLMERVWIPDV